MQGINSEALVVLCLLVLTVFSVMSMIGFELYFPCLWKRSQWSLVTTGIVHVVSFWITVTKKITLMRMSKN